MTRPPGAAGWSSVFSSSPAVEAAFGSQLLADQTSSSSKSADDPLGDVDHFLAIPWCHAHLRPPVPPVHTLSPGQTTTRVRVIVPQTRRQGPQVAASRTTKTADGFRMSRVETLDNAMTNTLNTPDTIASYVVFYDEPFVVLPDQRQLQLQPSLAPVVALKALMTVGAGVNGHRGIMHGGICATILDEILGLLVPLNQRRMRRLHRERSDSGSESPPQIGGDAPPGHTYTPAEEAAIGAASVDRGIVTAFLNITYVQPVKTSDTILVTARFTRREGPRKFFVEGDIRDANNQVCVKGEALFVTLKEKL